ncbi:uncharacterized protein AMSG_01463 [Thecamonas trahens ATCC 50062]|uniref:MARVEL domain-containing protein n=1 Tax=Thecamonas trahens ATCC 50062 TaxID=461836 RepID=A0A0L0DQP1_THETB|nr:hypothetical protein AMSG_01463 [Thecamonas trahens ATCC 50062]KNC54609.1 hypothetical protein AMSG_01463 [Thecamonas trahens ATCC 50062]|eukprot:XP_013761516.1 hypothetical protein AMSG_01463 [Thecamonas trahens ATCC 50062]
MCGSSICVAVNGLLQLLLSITILALEVATSQFDRPLVVGSAKDTQETIFLALVSGSLALSGMVAVWARSRESARAAYIFAYLQILVAGAAAVYACISLMTRADASHPPLDEEPGSAVVRASLLLGAFVLGLWGIVSGFSTGSKLESQFHYSSF